MRDFLQKEFYQFIDYKTKGIPMKKLIVLLLLCGCAVDPIAKQAAISKEKYNACLDKFPNTLSKCESKRRAYEIDRARAIRLMDEPNALQKIGEALQSGQQNVSPVYLVPQPQQQMWMQNIGGRTYNCNNFGGSVNCN